MTGFRAHPLDKPLKAMVDAMHNADQQLGLMSKDMGEFDSKELTPAEDELIFNFPSLRYSDKVHPQTGLPYTNAQAAQQLLQDIGPEQYVSYVNDFVRRADRRAKEGQSDTATGPESTPGRSERVPVLVEPTHAGQPGPGDTSADTGTPDR